MAPPDIKELFGDYLPNFVWDVEAREIEEHIKEGISKVIDALPTTEVKICDAPEILKHRAKNASLTGMTSPAPSAQRSASHSELAHGFGYAMKLCGTPRTEKPVYKVGYSSNPEGL